MWLALVVLRRRNIAVTDGVHQKKPKREAVVAASRPFS
jgi:hypothetical protein